MPFQSEKQRRYLAAKKPDVFREFAAKEKAVHKQDRYGGSGGHGRRISEAELVEKANWNGTADVARNAKSAVSHVRRAVGTEASGEKLAETRHAAARHRDPEVRREAELMLARRDVRRSRATYAGAGAAGLAAVNSELIARRQRKEVASKAALPNGLRRALGMPTIAKVPKKAPVKLPPLDDGPRFAAKGPRAPAYDSMKRERQIGAAKEREAARAKEPTRRAVQPHELYNTGSTYAPRGDPWRGGGRITIRKAARYYDPEHKRQRRLGMAEAGLLGGGLVATGLGVRGARNTTRMVRGHHPNMVGSKKELEALKGKLGRTVSAKPTDLALLGGGAAGIGGAAVVRQKAEGRKFGIWR